MNLLTRRDCLGRRSWLRVWLTSAALALLVTRGYTQGAVAPPGPPSAATANSNPSLGQFASQLAQGMDIITVCGFAAGCVMVMNGFLNARRDENWKMTVIHGLGVAGSVALCKTLFNLFVANAGSIVASF
jgi:hypothetical protein